MNYWLIKSEPNAFSIDDLYNCDDRISCWDGVRNYQARNMMRDQMKVGDHLFFYHSNCKPPGIVGIAKVVSKPYADHTAFDPDDHHFDPKSDPDKPRWMMVDVQFVRKFKHKISLDALKAVPQLENMVVLRRGNRLSITPVTKQEWEAILELENEVLA